MNVLVLDTASREAVVGLVSHGRLVALQHSLQASELLPRAFRAVLATAGLDQPDRMAVVRGPGSFTGIKVGLASAWGFARARDIPVRGLGRLEVLAAAAITAPLCDRPAPSPTGTDVPVPGEPAPLVPATLVTVRVQAWAGLVYAAVFSAQTPWPVRKGSYLLGRPAELVPALPEGTVLVEPAPGSPGPGEPGPVEAPFRDRRGVGVEACLLAMAHRTATVAPGPPGRAVAPLFLRLTEEKSW